MASSEDGSTDVFVSYSRSDTEFVRELVTELSKRGKRAWVDWEGIPPTAEWLEEIRAAIEASDALLFVISPESAASAMCREELVHAEQLGKRIVPVSLRAVDPSVLPRVLSSRQWVFLDEDRDLAESVSALAAVLDTDLDWVREHTQWLGKAREWERSGRDPSFLLRGSELGAAESWLTAPGAPEKEPPATPLQSEYVITSRRASVRRQRRFVVGISIALLVALALALVAFVQRGRAISERRTAVSELLASVSRQRLDASLDTGLLLAVAAYDTEKTAAARDAVLAGVRRTDGMQRILRIERSELAATTLSGDGRVVATATTDTILVHELESGRALAAIPYPEARSLALDETGSRLAVLGEGPVQLYALSGNGGDLAPKVVPQSRNALSLAFAPERPLLAVGTAEGRIVLYDLETRRTAIVATKTREGLDVPVPLPTLAFDKRGELLAAGSPVGPHVIDLRGAPESVLLPLDTYVSSLAFSPGGELLAVTGAQRLLALDPVTGETRCRSPLQALTAIRARQDDVVAIAANGVMHLLGDPCRESRRTLRGHSAEISALATGSERGRLVSVDAEGVAIVWSTRASTLTERSSTSMDASDVVHGAQEADVIVGGDGGVVLRASGGETSLEGAPAGVLALARADLTHVFAAAGRPAAVWTGPEYAREAFGPLPSALSVALAPEGELLALGRPGGVVQLWDLRERRLRGTLRTGGQGSVVAVAVGDSGRVAAGDNAGHIVTWDADGQRQDLAARGIPIDAIELSSDGKILAVAQDRGIVLWDLERREEDPLPDHHRAPIADLDFTPSGSQLVSADKSGVLLVWGVHELRRLGDGFRIGASATEGVDVDSRSGSVLTVGIDGDLVRIDSSVWDVESARRRICALVRRSLKPGEWEDAAPGLPRSGSCES